MWDYGQSLPTTSVTTWVGNQGSGIDNKDSKEAKAKRSGKARHSTTQGGFINFSALETQIQNLEDQREQCEHVAFAGLYHKVTVSLQLAQESLVLATCYHT